MTGVGKSAELRDHTMERVAERAVTGRETNRQLGAAVKVALGVLGIRTIGGLRIDGPEASRSPLAVKRRVLRVELTWTDEARFRRAALRGRMGRELGTEPSPG